MHDIGKYGPRAGAINDHVKGRTIEAALKDGTWLVLRMTDGHEYRIGWQDIHGNQVKGEPFMENQDVRIQLVGASLGGKAGGI